MSKITYCFIALFAAGTTCPPDSAWSLCSGHAADCCSKSTKPEIILPEYRPTPQHSVYAEEVHQLPGSSSYTLTTYSQHTVSWWLPHANSAPVGRMVPSSPTRGVTVRRANSVAALLPSSGPVVVQGNYMPMSSGGVFKREPVPVEVETVPPVEDMAKIATDLPKLGSIQIPVPVETMNEKLPTTESVQPTPTTPLASANEIVHASASTNGPRIFVMDSHLHNQQLLQLDPELHKLYEEITEKIDDMTMYLGEEWTLYSFRTFALVYNARSQLTLNQIIQDFELGRPETNVNTEPGRRHIRRIFIAMFRDNSKNAVVVFNGHGYPVAERVMLQIEINSNDYLMYTKYTSNV